MTDNLLLDTSAIMAFIEDEAGADMVQTLLIDAAEGTSIVYASFVSLTEVDYITRQEKDEQVATGRIADLKRPPIQWIHSDESLCAVAATLKAGHRISFADAFVAATALRCNAILVHKDPEFLQVGQGLRQLALPPKQ